MFLPEQHELLLQIIERPDDDPLRMVLADRLNERGDPLGELIVVQCALERLLDGTGTGDYRVLKAREAELAQKYGAQWHQAAAPFARKLTMKRGLPHTLRCTAEALLKDGGLTVLAPIQQLELDYVDASQLERLFALPLLHRITGLGIPSVSGMSWLTARPGQLPGNIVRLRFGSDGLRALDSAARLGLFDHVEELELSARWLLPEAIEALAPPAAPRLKKLSLVRLPPPERLADLAWRDALSALTVSRPTLTVVYRGIEYDAGDLPRLALRLEPDRLDETGPSLVPISKEPFGSLSDGESIARRLPSLLEFFRLPDGALLVHGALDGKMPVRMLPLSADASRLLSLEPHPCVLEAKSYAPDQSGLALRFEAWPSRSLAELELPFAVPVAMAVVQGIARALIALRVGLLRQGLHGFPTVLSLDDVLIGRDGAVKLLPPFRSCMLGERRRKEYLEWLRPLGHLVDPRREGTDDAVLELLGSALMHLLAGTPVSTRLNPSALSEGFRLLDPFVVGCLSPRRAERFPSLDAMLEWVNREGKVASQDEVARAGRERQSS